jgi:capsular exopolysaccharide synthesis family protein
MAKTYSALKRAEAEQGLKAELPAIPPSDQEMGAPFPSLKEPLKIELPYIMPRPPASRSLPFAVEEYQRMKYKIIHYDSDVIVKSMLFCSPGRREGTSTVLIHFAQTLAVEGNRVLLVDANLRNPYLHQTFHLPRENGLAEMIFSGSSFRNLDQFIKPTNLDNLWIITSGQPYAKPNSLLESGYLNDLNEHLKRQWDWILFDSPPMNAYSDSIALACQVDGIVMVVQAERTRWEVVQGTRDRLENCGGRILGIVLNKRRFHIPGFIYRLF